MPDETYQIPEAPEYRARDIRKLQDTDLADACHTFNPLVEGLLESIEYVHRQVGGMVARRGLTVPTEGWAEDGAGFFVDVPLEGVTGDMTPFAALAPESLEAARACGLSQTCETREGAVRFWAEKAPGIPLAVELLLVSPGGGAGGTGSGGAVESFTLLPATPERLGGVKIGENVNVAADGTIWIDGGAAGPAATDEDVEAMLDSVFGKPN